MLCFLVDINKPGLEEPTAASGGSSGMESFAWQDIPEAPLWPWCPLVNSMPRTQPCDKELRVSQQPLPQTQLPVWLTNSADAPEGRAKGGGGGGGSSYTELYQPASPG